MNLKHIGHDKTLERGLVEVWRDTDTGEIYVSYGYRDACEEPRGIRMAPIGTENAVKGREPASPDFQAF